MIVKIVVGAEVKMGHKTLWAVDADGKLAHTEPVCTVHVCAPAVFTPEQIAAALTEALWEAAAAKAPPPGLVEVEGAVDLLERWRTYDLPSADSLRWERPLGAIRRSLSAALRAMRGLP